MKARGKLRLGELLLREGAISEEQLKTALDKQKASGQKIGEILVELGYVDEFRMLNSLARYLNVPYIDLNQFRYSPDLSRLLLPEAQARRCHAVLLEESPDGLLVGMADPTNLYAYDQLAQVLPGKFRAALVRRADLQQVLNTIYRHTEEISSLAESLGEELGGGNYDLQQIANADASSTEAPVVKLLYSLFQDAFQIRASDVHIEPEENSLRIRSRVDGILQEQVLDEKRIASALVTRLKLMAGLDIAEKRLPQDGRFNIKIRGQTVDVRLSTLPIAHGESVVMRLLDHSNNALNLEQLGLSGEVEKEFRAQIRRPHGLMLVTGPTGSGKTTSLYAALSSINTADHKIITVEDPVEYRLPRINQVQVNYRIELDFARVLRAVLRQDPDVIMIGEMRDQETVEIGLRAAMTGHLVLSTLHTNNAVATVNRLMDMGAQGYLLAASLNAVMSQQLVRRICEGCSTAAPPDAATRAWLRHQTGGEVDISGFCKGSGCVRCNNTGYRGRIGVYELLVIDEALTEALRKSDISAFARAARAQKTFKPLLRTGLEMAADGLTSAEEVMRVAGMIEHHGDA